MNNQIPFRTLTVAGAGWGARAGRAMTQATQTLGAEGRQALPGEICTYVCHVCLSVLCTCLLLGRHMVCRDEIFCLSQR